MYIPIYTAYLYILHMRICINDIYINDIHYCVMYIPIYTAYLNILHMGIYITYTAYALYVYIYIYIYILRVAI